MRPTRINLFVHGAIGAVLVWAYWPTLLEAVGRWRDDPQYSHGFLVPIFSAYLLWRNRKTLATGADREIDELLGKTARVAVCVVERRALIRILL